MGDKRQLEFFLLRYVPDAVKDEFVNIGLVLLEEGEGGFADVRFTRDWRRVRCLDPAADFEMLESLEREIRGQLANVRDRELLLKRLNDSYSNLVQLSPVKGCLAEDPAKEIETMAKLYFEGPKRGARLLPAGRQLILKGMRDAFEQASVWSFLDKGIAVAPYTKAGDPLKIDFGYRVGNEIKMFHAVSLKASVEQALVVAYGFPRIAAGMAAQNHWAASLTAVVEDGLDREQEETGFALSMLEDNRVRIAAVGEMPGIADKARLELRA